MGNEICKVVIPSHKRHDRVLTTSAVNNAILCVAESQASLYRACNPDIEVVTHPDSVIGLNPKRNWIIKHFGTVFQLDDDIWLSLETKKTQFSVSFLFPYKISDHRIMNTEFRTSSIESQTSNLKSS